LVSERRKYPNAAGWVLFQAKLDRFTDKCVGLWEDAALTLPRLGAPIPLSCKHEREALATREMTEIEKRLRRVPRSPKNRNVWGEALLRRTKTLARGCLGFPDGGLQLLFNRQGLEATREFVRAAKSFDPCIKDASLFQALRNVWIVNTIQSLLDKPLSLSPAIFGYSMLYPWTDNYLDDPQLQAESKHAFGAWLEQRLCGSDGVPIDAHASEVGRLVGLIEGCFPRTEFEDVYLSLRAIHHAQMASMDQHTTRGVVLSERELLCATFRKGGTSVLPDAYLVAGTLSDAEAQFMFGFGVLLQLIDDLQDLQTDLANGHATLFARKTSLLDGVTTRLWSFAQAVLWSPGRFDAPQHQPIKSLIQESCKLMILQAVARHRHLYSPTFAAELEAASPFRFSFMRDRENAAAREGDKMLSLLRQQRQVGSAFDVLV
jgi:hypothetical protein